MVENSTRTKEKLFYKVDHNKQPVANKNYKDTIFRKLFHEKKEHLELYNALNNSNYSEEQAVEIAIDECIKEGILSEFLSRNRAEAIMFSIYEHNEEREWQKLRESEREYGIEIGREEERNRLIQNLMNNRGMTLEEAKELLGIGSEFV